MLPRLKGTIRTSKATFASSTTCSTRPFFGSKGRSHCVWSRKSGPRRRSCDCPLAGTGPQAPRPAGLAGPVPAADADSRAFSLYFDLINLAEQRARVRALRQRAEDPAIQNRSPTPRKPHWPQLKDRGITADQVARRSASAASCFPYSRPIRAKPAGAPCWKNSTRSPGNSTGSNMCGSCRANASRRSTPIAGADRDVLAHRHRPRPPAHRARRDPPRPGDGLRHAVRDRAAGLSRPRRGPVPTYSRARRHPCPAFLRFGSWIGGDRDGNPNVTHDVTREAVRLHQETILRHYIAQVAELGRRLSSFQHFLKPGDELMQSLEVDATLRPRSAEGRAICEPYRRKCRYHHRPGLEQHARAVADPPILEWSQEETPPARGDLSRAPTTCTTT